MRARGIVLVTTLIMVAVVVMLVGAAVTLMPGTTSLAADARSQTLALQAAETGLAYAQARLQTVSPGWDWAGSLTDQVRTVERDDLTVVEDHGNVIGIIRTPDGTTSEFVLRFNPQNGTNDPDLSHIIESPFISVNNLKVHGPVPVHAGDGPGWSLTSSVRFDCQPQEAVLFVEGRAGDGLRSASVDDPYPFAGNQRVVTRLIECHFRKKKGAQDVTRGALFAADELDIRVSKEYEIKKKDTEGGIELNSTSESAPEVFVNGNVYATDHAGTTDRLVATHAAAPQGTIHAKGQFKNSLAPLNTAVKNNQNMPGFPQLDWESLQMPPAPETIKAGIYMWRGTGKAKQLYYYDGKYEDYQAGAWTPPPPAGADLVTTLKPSLGSGFAKDLLEPKSGGELKIRTDLTVEPSALGANSLAIVTEGADFGNQNSDGQVFTFEPPKGQMLYLNSGLGNLYLEGKVEGSKGASLMSAGNLSLAGGGSNVNAYGTVQDIAVNLYSKGKISMKTRLSDGSYEPMSLRGLIYSWGDIDLDAGKRGVRIRGALVAYGTDPHAKPSQSEAGSATVNGKGRVAIRASQVRLNYDDAVNAGLQTGTEGGPIGRCFWASY